jgi:hypothetical protein
MLKQHKMHFHTNLATIRHLAPIIYKFSQKQEEIDADQFLIEMHKNLPSFAKREFELDTEKIENNKNLDSHEVNKIYLNINALSFPKAMILLLQ